MATTAITHRQPSIKDHISSFLTKKGYVSQRDVAGQIATIMAEAAQEQMDVVINEPDTGYESDPYNRGWLNTFAKAHHDAMGRLNDAMANPFGWLPVFSSSTIAKKEKALVDFYHSVEVQNLKALHDAATEENPIDEDAAEEIRGARDAWSYWYYG